VAQIWNMQELVQNIKASIAEETIHLQQKGIVPCLGIIRVGRRPDDISYERGIIKNAEAVGIKTQVLETDQNISMEDFTKLIREINEDNDIHGILMFRPLPTQLAYDVVKHLISPLKDIDCCNPLNLAKVFEGDSDVFYPSTPEAVVEILKYFAEPLEGSNIVIINRSMVVGKPLAMMLVKEGATVTICNSKTRDLFKVSVQADVVVTAIAKANYFDAGYFNENAAVIDVGINVDEKGKLCGDVNFENVSEKVRAITPVPGGVGSVTTVLLLRHVLAACKKQM
jgi:methylenetetrahydrofolate dehydrogenase (NADP+)/methenyltetrahydrofolate cyclohydrolase